MRRRHFEAFRPVCPVCLRRGAGHHPLVIALVAEEAGADIRAGLLHCPNPPCQHEYPIIDGMPLIVPELRRLLADRGVEVMVRSDLPAPLESLLGDAIGPDSWLDALRQTVSTYAWDAWAAMDPAEQPDPNGPQPGAVRRCLQQLVAMAGPAPAGLVVDAGCGAGGSTAALAAADPDALVLGCDIHLATLRVARRTVVDGQLRYARRRIGLVYDRREAAIAVPGAERIDFWACDANCLPFAPAGIARIAALNLLDCVPDPPGLLAALSAQLLPQGQLLLATPFDWATRATPQEMWLGGHSQRGEGAGAAEPQLARVLAMQGQLAVLAQQPDWPWQTRLHDRSHVAYRTLLLAAQRLAEVDQSA